MFFKEAGSKKVCLLCQHYCILGEGQSGICGVNHNSGEKIECLVYGQPSAMHLDPIEKKPLYHFMPNTTTFSLGTIGCNFKCSFCQNHSISQERTIPQNEIVLPEQIVNRALEVGASSISYTYNEPTIFYPYIEQIAHLAHQKGLKNIMVSNGYESREVLESMNKHIDAVNIDLKSFNTNYYKKKLGGRLDRVLANIEDIASSPIHMEITTLIVPTHNDSDEEITQIAQFIAQTDPSIPWHISAFHPAFKEPNLPRTPTQTLKRAYQIGKEAGLKYVHVGNTLEFQGDSR
jgi:pyruvate formate lyase activating enzyme